MSTSENSRAKIVNVYDFLELFLLTVALFREKLLMMKPSPAALSTKQSAVHHRAIAFNVKSLDMSLVEFPSRMALTLTRRTYTAQKCREISDIFTAFLLLTESSVGVAVI